MPHEEVAAGYQLTRAGLRRPISQLSRHHLEHGIPLVLPGLCRSWPANSKWSIAWLKQQFAEREIVAGSDRLAFGEFLDQVVAGSPANPSPYLREHFIAEWFPELLPDIRPLPADNWNRLNCRLLHGISQYRHGAPDLLIAGAGTRFPVLHYDLHHLHAFITQVRGDKIVWLYPPDQGRFLYPRANLRNVSQISSFTPVDANRYPDYQHASCLEVRLAEGDAIFIPSGWWHRTQVVSTSVAVTWNVVNASNWEAFISDCYFGGNDGKTAKGRARQLRLAAVQAWLALREKSLN
jgi:hypothetical protein